MTSIEGNTRLRAECTPEGARWFRENLGRVVDTPEHGPAVIQRVDVLPSARATQATRYYVVVLPVPSWIDGVLPHHC